MKFGDKSLRALARAFVGGLGLGLAAVQATAQTPIAGPFLNGTYEIEVALKGANGYVIPYGCMILGNSGTSAIPSLFKWSGNGHYCNLDVASSQTLWKIYPIFANGLVRHVIMSLQTGQCLIRSQAGTATNASMYLWPDNLDKHFCGFKTARDFVNNGQAAWNFSQLGAYSISEYGYADGDIMYSGPVMLQPPNKPQAFLMFSPTPASSPSSVSDVSLATFSDLPTNWLFYFFASSMVPVPIPNQR
jgi:hypothetical protein